MEEVINPATAAKELSLLVDENILFKKRGLGMFVTNGAKERIMKQRKNQTLKRLIQEIVKEANQLQINETELIEMIRAVIHEEGGQ